METARLARKAPNADEYAQAVKELEAAKAELITERRRMTMADIKKIATRDAYAAASRSRREIENFRRTRRRPRFRHQNRNL